MLVSGRLKPKTFRAWLLASEARLAEIPADHEVHRLIRAVRPNVRRGRGRADIAAELRTHGLFELASAPPTRLI